MDRTKWEERCDSDVKNPCPTICLSDRIAYKLQNGIEHDLDPQEREYVENLLVDDFADRTRSISNEELMKLADEKGLI